MNPLPDTLETQAGEPAPAAAAAEPARESPREVVRRLGATGPLALGALVLPPIGTLGLVLTAPYTGPWLREQGGVGVAVYIAGFALFAGLALLPTYAQAILGGFVFGLAWGLPAALVGFLAGGLIGYEVARRVSGDRVVEIIDTRPRMRVVRDALIGPEGGHGFWKTLGMVTLLRMPPNSPFALTNLVMASVHVPRAPFLMGTLLGMAPRTIAGVFIGQGLDQLTDESIKEATPRWLWIVGIVVTLAIATVIGMLAKRALDRVANGHARA